MNIPSEIADRIKAVSKLSDVVEGLQPKGRQFYCACPKCGAHDTKKKTGLLYTPSKELVKCFKCGWGTSSAVTYVMETQNKSYPEALEFLANMHHIDIENQDSRKERLEYERNLKQKARKTFRDKQMEESGLSDDDITCKMTDEDGTEHFIPTFKSGTRDQYGNIQPGQGDDMLIYYFDLQGRQVMYRQEKSNRMKPLIRVRWQNPELHQDKEGKPKKYESPYGSGSHIYIPEKIRLRYKSATPVETLFIQEGEKKAEKATKHTIPSIGIMGIQNIGNKSHVLPQDIQLIIQRCETRQVVFMLDSDWDHLSENLRPGEAVDQRPRSFFYAVKNYKEYMRTLVNLGISVEIWFGYVKPNPSGAKGIDDLLVTELKGREKELSEDIEKAMHHKDGSGQWVQLHKITMMVDNQIADLWLLNDAEAFAKKHKERLIPLPEFQIGKLKRRFNEKGTLELAQPLLPGEQFWEEFTLTNRNGDERKELQFDYANCFNFLQNRGYHRVRMKSNNWEFVHIENRVVYKVDNYDIKDFVTDFAKEIKRKDVMNMLYRGGPQYLGHEKLSNLEFTRLSVEKAARDSQCLFFQDKIWYITADGIQELSYGEFKNHVWEDKVIRAKVTVLKPLIDVQRMDEEFRSKVNEEYRSIPDGTFLYDFTEPGQQCHFMQFLKNTSDFTWKKRHRLKGMNGSATKDDQITPEEMFDDARHLINKLTAIGYLLHDYKNDSELKAVIGMDGKLSEIGTSNGRTGKSIIGKAVEFLIPQVYIPAKSKKITEDNFLFGEVTEKTKNIFLDDVRSNIDFEFFFPLITGKLKVNPKGTQPFTLEQEDTPKLYLTTNHAISGEGASFKDRQAFMVFSDYYNDEHKPVDDFGINFFSEWENDQWNLFYNLMANCLMLYFRSIREGWSTRNAGIVEPPMDNVEKRQLRQMIGEDFLQWADTAYAIDDKGEAAGASYLNSKCIRKELFDEFLKQYPGAIKYNTSTTFGKRMRAYCRYKGYHFNPNMTNENGMNISDFQRHYPGQLFVGREDKSGGKEYWTIGSDKYNGSI